MSGGTEGPTTKPRSLVKAAGGVLLASIAWSQNRIGQKRGLLGKSLRAWIWVVHLHIKEGLEAVSFQGSLCPVTAGIGIMPWSFWPQTDGLQCALLGGYRLYVGFTALPLPHPAPFLFFLVADP